MVKPRTHYPHAERETLCDTKTQNAPVVGENEPPTCKSCANKLANQANAQLRNWYRARNFAVPRLFDSEVHVVKPRDGGTPYERIVRFVVEWDGLRESA